MVNYFFKLFRILVGKKNIGIISKNNKWEEGEESVRSLIYNRNRSGPRIDP